jgi:hypothetical protein
MEEYRKIAGKRESILDLLAMPEMAEIWELGNTRQGN